MTRETGQNPPQPFTVPVAGGVKIGPFYDVLSRYHWSTILTVVRS